MRTSRECSSALPAWDAIPPSGDTILTENSPVGTSFLAKVDLEGEEATGPASEAGIRVMHLRIPPVVGGAALKQLGMFGGDGRQWMSLGGPDELGSIIEFVLRTESHHRTGQPSQSQPDPRRRVCRNGIAGPGTKTGRFDACLPGAPADGRDGRGVRPRPAGTSCRTNFLLQVIASGSLNLNRQCGMRWESRPESYGRHRGHVGASRRFM